MNVRPDEKIIELSTYGIRTVKKDITVALSDPIFYYEYMVTDMIVSISQRWQDNKITKKELATLHKNLLTLLLPPNFNTNRVLRNVLERLIETKISTMSVFNNIFKDKIAVQAEMLDYLAMGDWRFKSFTPNDRVYLISYNNHNELPLLWMVISVNDNLGVARLHVWSLSLLAYFVQILGLQNFQIYKGMPIFCLSHQLSLLGPGIQRLYYSPFLRDNTTKLITSNTLTQLTMGKDKTEIAQDENESLGETYYIPIDDHARGVYKTMDLTPTTIKMCVVCETNVGAYYTKEYGEDVRFCGQQCLESF